ncbi:MAG: DUF916 domain-containing protein [Actinomycetota bacterium]|nr:DUF916 domain-containing protein [Actinomycetota bacterium]
MPAKTGYFVLSARPGATVRGRVEVTNTGSAGAVALYAVDGTTGKTTGAVYRSRQERRVDVGRWIKLTPSRVTVPAGKMTLVTFRVRIPAHASRGQHLGGIVAEPLSPVARRSTTHGKHSFQVRIKELAVVAVEVKLPGPLFQRMAITSIGAATQSGRQTLELGLANTGDALLKGKGSLVVSRASGRRVLSQAFKLDTFVPRTQIAYPLAVATRALPAGDYRGTVKLTYGRGHHLIRTLRFSIGSKQLAHLSHANRPPPAASGSHNDLLLILSGVGLVLLGVVASATYFKAQGRKAALASPTASGDAQAGTER